MIQLEAQPVDQRNQSKGLLPRLVIFCVQGRRAGGVKQPSEAQLLWAGGGVALPQNIHAGILSNTRGLASCGLLGIPWVKLCSLKVHMLRPQSPLLLSVALFGDRAFKEVVGVI